MFRARSRSLWCSHSAYGSSRAFPSRPVVKVGDDARPAQLTAIAANLPGEPVSDHDGEQFPRAGVLAAGAGDLRPACKAFHWQFVVGRVSDDTLILQEVRGSALH